MARTNQYQPVPMTQAITDPQQQDLMRLFMYLLNEYRPKNVTKFIMNFREGLNGFRHKPTQLCK